MFGESDTEFWARHKEGMVHMRGKRRTMWDGITADLENEGMEVREITQYQFRVNERLDIYPSNKRWHDIETGHRGRIEMPFDAFVRHFFSPQWEKPKQQQ